MLAMVAASPDIRNWGAAREKGTNKEETNESYECNFHDQVRFGYRYACGSCVGNLPGISIPMEFCLILKCNSERTLSKVEAAKFSENAVSVKFSATY